MLLVYCLISYRITFSADKVNNLFVLSDCCNDIVLLPKKCLSSLQSLDARIVCCEILRKVFPVCSCRCTRINLILQQIFGKLYCREEIVIEDMMILTSKVLG